MDMKNKVSVFLLAIFLTSSIPAVSFGQGAVTIPPDDFMGNFIGMTSEEIIAQQKAAEKKRRDDANKQLADFLNGIDNQLAVLDRMDKNSPIYANSLNAILASLLQWESPQYLSLIGQEGQRQLRAAQQRVIGLIPTPSLAHSYPLWTTGGAIAAGTAAGAITTTGIVYGPRALEAMRAAQLARQAAAAADAQAAYRAYQAAQTARSAGAGSSLLSRFFGPYAVPALIGGYLGTRIAPYTDPYVAPYVSDAPAMIRQMTDQWRRFQACRDAGTLCGFRDAAELDRRIESMTRMIASEYRSWYSRLYPPANPSDLLFRDDAEYVQRMLDAGRFTELANPSRR